MAQVSCPTCQPAAGDWGVEKEVFLCVWVCGGKESSLSQCLVQLVVLLCFANAVRRKKYDGSVRLRTTLVVLYLERSYSVTALQQSRTVSARP